MLEQRWIDERHYHDAEAAQRAVTFTQEPQRLRFSDASYLDHVPWIRPAFRLLGDVSGKRVLDLGCGHGMAAVVMARRGALVTACDLSAGYVAEARQRALANEAIIEFSVAAAEQLPFADQSFDAIWGHAILHHLELPLAVVEIHRVLRPGGIAVFCEPWDGNPLIRWMRRWRCHTADERALAQADLKLMQECFGNISVKSFQWNRYVVIGAHRICGSTM